MSKKIFRVYYDSFAVFIQWVKSLGSECQFLQLALLPLWSPHHHVYYVSFFFYNCYNSFQMQLQMRTFGLFSCLQILLSIKYNGIFILLRYFTYLCYFFICIGLYLTFLLKWFYNIYITYSIKPLSLTWKNSEHSTLDTSFLKCLMLESVYIVRYCV